MGGSRRKEISFFLPPSKSIQHRTALVPPRNTEARREKNNEGKNVENALWLWERG